MTDVDLTLRSPQVNYLEYLAERDEVPLYRALAKVLTSAIERALPDAAAVRPKKARKHFVISPQHLAFIDKKADEWGLSRSDVARRIIDEELSVDLTV